MQTLGTKAWPVLIVSDQIQKQSDEGAWLRELVGVLTDDFGCSVLFCSGYGDAHDLVYAREDLGTVIVDWESAELGRVHRKNDAIATGNSGERFVRYVRSRNARVPILILSDRSSVESLPNRALERVNGVIWKLTDTPRFNAGRIERSVAEYAGSVLPAFFQALVSYADEYNAAWHTPGHMGGQGFLQSPSGTAFHKFFGENMLRADLSISVPELGSLLDHSGVTGKAERFSAAAFGADRCYYVLNGTSTGNQIVWRSQLAPGEACILDRNCHKSMHHAMIATGARPTYLQPVRNALGMIGPVDFRSVPAGASYAMAALTNSTYDGICYDAAYAAAKLGGASALHFDEAWFAYARFHPIYSGRYAMSLSDRRRLVFSTQSTHKLLTALSQASMIHVKFPADLAASPARAEDFHRRFNETYMMHGSTSPQYAMVASLEVASKMMADNGATALGDIMEEAIELRRKIAGIAAEEEAQGDWFFRVWQPEGVSRASTRDLIENPGAWILEPGAAWHGFPACGLPDPFCMLDPIKLTFLCPGVDSSGRWAERGVPAAIVTRFLGDHGVVCEKTDYYSWLLLNSLGTTKGKQGTLVAALFRFRELYARNAPLDEVFPDLADAHPVSYQGVGLADHCQAMHQAIRQLELLPRMVAASKVLPVQTLCPSDAHRAIVQGRVETVRLDSLDPTASPRTAAVMVAPYPPGIPLLMGGEILDASSAPIVDYLRAREDFERSFPGYGGDIHGVERGEPGSDGWRPYTLMVVRD